jgi:hypothetical protein
MRVDSSLQKKMKKMHIHMNASRILENLGHPIVAAFIYSITSKYLKSNVHTKFVAHRTEGWWCIAPITHPCFLSSSAIINHHLCPEAKNILAREVSFRFTSTCFTRGPSTDQHPPSLRPSKKEGKNEWIPKEKDLGMEQRERRSQKILGGTIP